MSTYRLLVTQPQIMCYWGKGVGTWEGVRVYYGVPLISIMAKHNNKQCSCRVLQSFLPHVRTEEEEEVHKQKPSQSQAKPIQEVAMHTPAPPILDYFRLCFGIWANNFFLAFCHAIGHHGHGPCVCVCFAGHRA